MTCPEAGKAVDRKEGGVGNERAHQSPMRCLELVSQAVVDCRFL